MSVGIVVFAALLIGALWIAVAQVVQVERESAVQAAIARGDDLAIAFEHYAIRTIESADLALQDLVQESAPAAGQFSLAHFQSDYSIEKSAFIDVIMADAAGNAISIARHGTPAIAPNVADQEHFTVHAKRDTGTFYVSKTVEDRVAGKYVIPVTRRINNADGSFGGVAMAMIEPARFTDVFESVGLHHLDAVLLTGVDGIIRARLQGSKLTWGEDTSSSMLFAEQRVRPNGHYLTQGKVDGVSRYFSYRTLRDTRLIAVVGIAESDALAGFILRRQRYWDAAGLASFAIAGFTIALLLALAARQRATARLVKGHARYAATFSSVPVGIARSDLAGHFLEANPALHDILGYSNDALLGRTFTEITYPEDVAALNELHRNAIEKPQPAHPVPVEVRLVRSDGSLAWCFLTASLVRDGSDASSYLVTAVKDITERKFAESALADLSERTARRERILNTMLSSISDFAFMFDRDCRFIFVNQPLLDLWGIPLEAAVGRNFSDLGYPEPMAAKLHQQIRQVFETNHGITDETPYTSPAGQQGYYEYIFSPVPGADGTVEYVAGSTRDFTERRRAEIAVRESEVKFRQLADTINDAFWILAPDLASVEYVSPAFAQIWGRSVASVYANPRQWAEYVLPEDRERVSAAFTALRGGEADLEIEYRIARPNGETRWVHSRGFPVRDPAGKVVRLTGVSSDITELKRVMEDLQELNVSLEQRVEERTQELETANRAKSTFLATVSHEIRTPLNGVIGMLELLSLTKLDAQQRTSIEVVRQSSHSLTRIIDDILDYSKIEAGKLAIHAEVASVQAAVQAATVLYGGIAESKSLSLTRIVDERIGPAHWFDPQRLQQILNNIVSNALKFTDKGHVEIRAESIEQSAESQTILFTIADTGIGISPEDQKRLFQPFSQIEATSTRRFGGTGLGLSICRQLAEMMGGSIEVKSAPGAGTKFMLKLAFPVADPAQLPAQHESVRTEPLAPALGWRAAPGVEEAVAEGTLVLVVDDHGVNRMVLMQQIQALGYAVETAEDGLDGLEKWKSGRYGLVLADCNMPVMDGYEMVRQIRAIEASSGAKRTPIIACTANAMDGEAERTFAAGMDDYLSKPLELHDVQRKMGSWLPLPESGRPPAQPQVSGVSGTPPATTIDHAVDPDVFAALSRGNLSTQRNLIALFRKVNDQDTLNLRLLVSGQDGEATKSTAHRIKGASRMLGAFRLAALAEQIETAGHGQDWPEVAIAMPPFEAELVRVNTFLDSL